MQLSFDYSYNRFNTKIIIIMLPLYLTLIKCGTASVFLLTSQLLKITQTCNGYNIEKDSSRAGYL